MFAAVRLPASRTTSAYICRACRSKHIANPQQWRSLNTESHTPSAIQDLPPPPPPPQPSSPFSEHATKPGTRKKTRKVAAKALSSIADHEVKENAIIPTEPEDAAVAETPASGSRRQKASKLLTKRKRRSPQTAETKEIDRIIHDERKARAKTRALLTERKVPPVTYALFVMSGSGKLRNRDGWRAQIAYADQVFETTHPKKHIARNQVQEKVLEYLATLSSSDATNLDLGASTIEDKTGETEALESVRSARQRMIRHLETFGGVRVRRIQSKTESEGIASKEFGGDRRVDSKRESKGMTLKEALSNLDTTFRRGSVAGPRSTRRTSQDTTKQAKITRTAHVLPKNVQSYFKPSSRIDTINASSLEARPLHIPQTPVPPLSYGLDRVLFNPGVYRLRDPRSRVYNFDPYLEKVGPAAEFDFSALKGYKVASSDTTLADIAAENGLKYFTSTSSLTSVLMTFHFLISQWRPINVGMLSRTFDSPPETGFTTFTKAPTSVILKPRNGGYAIDKDDDGVGNTVLSLVGRSLEKLLTVPKDVFERYRKSKETGQSSVDAPDTDEAYHYTGIGNLLVRSQLDGHDARLPGSGIFDIKTRAVLPIRMDGKGKMDIASSYEIINDHGRFESFEREFHDMLRAPMLKYSMQARLGRMDGIFVAYHNISRLFGFQYVNLEEIDQSLHGSRDTYLGDQELRASITMLQDVLDRASTRFPDQVFTAYKILWSSLLLMICSHFG
jgi:hypothetical protein